MRSCSVSGSVSIAIAIARNKQWNSTRTTTPHAFHLVGLLDGEVNDLLGVHSLQDSDEQTTVGLDGLEAGHDVLGQFC